MDIHMYLDPLDRQALLPNLKDGVSELIFGIYNNGGFF